MAINATRDGKATTIIRTQSSSIFTTSYHDNDNEYGFAVFVEFDAGKTFDNLTIFPQIELGTTATDYEPPIIGREIALSACGKNLADFADVGGKTVSGTTIAYDSDNGYIVLNGTATAQIYIGIKVHLVAGTYTVSGAAASNVRLVLRNKAWVNIADAITNATITVTSDDYYVHIAVPKGTVCDNVIFRPQIELGDTATDYEPYHGSTVTITPDSNPYTVPNDIRQQDGHNVISVSDGTLSVTGCKDNAAIKRIWDSVGMDLLFDGITSADAPAIIDMLKYDMILITYVSNLGTGAEFAGQLQLHTADIKENYTNYVTSLGNSSTYGIHAKINNVYDDRRYNIKIYGCKSVNKE